MRTTAGRGGEGSNDKKTKNEGEREKEAWHKKHAESIKRRDPLRRTKDIGEQDTRPMILNRFGTRPGRHARDRP